MHTVAERRFGAIINLGRIITHWASNSEPHQEIWTREERHEAYTAIKTITGRYLDIRTCTNEDIATAYHDVILSLLEEEVSVELVH